MKSMEIEFQGHSGTGSCFSNLYGLCHHGLAWVQVVHDLYNELWESWPGKMVSDLVKGLGLTEVAG